MADAPAAFTDAQDAILTSMAGGATLTHSCKAIGCGRCLTARSRCSTTFRHDNSGLRA